MAKQQQVQVPDIGDFEAVEVIEVLVNPGQRIEPETPLITLESDKASMEVPSPRAGLIRELCVQVGDKVSQGSPILILEEAAEQSPEDAPAKTAATPQETRAQTPSGPTRLPLEEAKLVADQPIQVPDIGDFEAVEVIEVLVNPGQRIEPETPLITLESDKASMEVPSPRAGLIRELCVQVGDKVSQGSPILILEEAAEQSPEDAPAKTATTPQETTTKDPGPASPPAAPPPAPPPAAPKTASSKQRSASSPASSPQAPPGLPSGAETVGASHSARAHASPSVRRFARELGVDLGLVRGSGPKGRILKEDVKSFTKAVLSRDRLFNASTQGAPTVARPPIDFSKYGPVEHRPLGRLKRLAGQNLLHTLNSVPQVTQFGEADISELEEFRRSRAKEAQRQEIKLTLLSFLIKAVAVALREFPEFNASLDPEGARLVIKRYYHVGVAVDTPNGLVVPVLRDVDQKGLLDLARELQETANRARASRLKPGEQRGGCFTISSLGGIAAGTFTPIINAPEVAILGVSRATMRPVLQEDGKHFAPRLILPLALSYDHRVVDGVAGARFVALLASVLGDIRRVLL